jgi:glutamate/tyrosine decarboxylase-like PLP-dependent enzyme
MTHKEELDSLLASLEQLSRGFSDLPAMDPAGPDDQITELLMEAATRMQDNYPYFHPLYAGQMLKPPHPIARLAYMMAMWINPNNHALDGGRASSRMEKEAVADIAGMVGWSDALGHLTGGGTLANMEALWVASQLRPGTGLVASEQAHYTHQRLAQVLNIPFQSIPCDDRGRMDPDALRTVLKNNNVGTVVATIGTTGTGAVDPVDKILELQKHFNFRLHADAAYGGYFILTNTLAAETQTRLQMLDRMDSIAIDPHKHGLQPYGCGCVLFRDPSVGRFYQHDSPYTYFTSQELHLGEISLECSRAGAAAVALWTTLKRFPLTPDGEFADQLGQCHSAASTLYKKLTSDSRFRVLFEPELDIVVWAPQGHLASTISQQTERLFQLCADRGLHLATFAYPSDRLKALWPDVHFDSDTVRCLRSCLMKPEHLNWIDRIWSLLLEAADHLKETDTEHD